MEKAEFQLFSGAGLPTSKRRSTRPQCLRITPAVTGTPCTVVTIVAAVAVAPDLGTAKTTAEIATAMTAESATAIGTATATTGEVTGMSDAAPPSANTAETAGIGNAEGATDSIWMMIIKEGEHLILQKISLRLSILTATPHVHLWRVKQLLLVLFSLACYEVWKIGVAIVSAGG